MRIAVSNLLWTPDRDDEIGRLLRRNGIDAIDVAPTRYAADPVRAPASLWRDVRAAWADRGIAITGMQSLLHGGPGLSIFGDDSARTRTRDRLLALLDVAVLLGARPLVFGSWQNRVRGDLPLPEAVTRAATFFAPIAAAAAERGVFVAVEPVHAGYGNDFLVDHAQAASLVEAVDHPGLRLTLDIGCLGLAGEDVDRVLTRCGHLVGHVQLAEPGLVPLAAGNPLHAAVGPRVDRALPGRVACAEALTPDGEDAAAAVARSLAVALAHYR